MLNSPLVISSNQLFCRAGYGQVNGMIKPYPMNLSLLNGNGNIAQICCMLDGLEKMTTVYVTLREKRKLYLR